MKFYSHYKTSFVDYPGKISTVLFISGCNLDCAYCHNFNLKRRQVHKLDQRDIFNFIEQRKELIDAIVVTGGEPSLYGKDIKNFFVELSQKFPFFLKKVDTNGTNPDFIRCISKYVDFISMDFKTLYYEKYLHFSRETIMHSIDEVKKVNDYEIRITLYPGYILPSDFEQMAEILNGVKRVVIQQYRPVDKIGTDNLIPYNKEVLIEFSNVLEKHAINVTLRE